MSPRLAFLGAGNMASAMVDGLLAKMSAAASDLACYSPSGKSAAALAGRTGIRRADSPADLLDRAQVLIVAFKPQHLAAMDPILAELSAGRLIVSILAGKRLETLALKFPQARNIVRCMPNTPGQIGAGVTAWCAARPLAEKDKAVLELILGALGRSLEVAEADMDAVTAVSGSGPAYVFEFAAALREAGMAAGLAEDVAADLATETILGAARLMARKKTRPEALRDAVTSPNGTTFAALQKLSAGNFRGLIKDAVLAAKARSAELSGQ